MRRAARLALLVAIGVSVVGCSDGDDDEDAEPFAVPDGPGSLVEYCAVAARLDAAGSEAFAELGAEAAGNVVARAYDAFLREQRADVERLIASAPPEIRDTVADWIEVQQQIGDGDLDLIGSTRANVLDAQVEAFERDRCKGPIRAPEDTAPNP